MKQLILIVAIVTIFCFPTSNLMARSTKKCVPTKNGKEKCWHIETKDNPPSQKNKEPSKLWEGAKEVLEKLSPNNLNPPKNNKTPDFSHGGIRS